MKNIFRSVVIALAVFAAVPALAQSPAADFKAAYERGMAYFNAKDLAKARTEFLAAYAIQPEPTVLFTQRTMHLRNHSGQVSFPGGRAEPEDPTPEFTALREAEEEIGVPREQPFQLPPDQLPLARVPPHHQDQHHKTEQREVI